jgi:tetratricopeptide (TPR) repeat protein
MTGKRWGSAGRAARTAAAVAGSLLIVALPPAIGAKGAKPSVDQAVAAARAGDCATALRLLAPSLDAPDTLTPDQAGLALNVGIACALRTKQPQLAYPWTLQATTKPDADDRIWRLRLALEMGSKKYDAAAATVAALAQGRGAVLNSIPLREMYELDNEMRTAGDIASRRRVLPILIDYYRPTDPPLPVADGFRRRYADLLYNAGDTEGALGQARPITVPGILIGLSLDARFRSVVPSAFDARASATSYLDVLRDAASRHPESLDVVIELAGIQRLLGRPDDALATLNAADPTRAGAATYTDKADQLNWWWDEVARAREQAGQFDAAVAALRQGIAAPEGGGANVSQTINLADLQLRLGRYEDALETLAVFEREKRPVSPYGEMELRYARGCAAFRGGKGDPHGDIAYVKAHAADNPGVSSDLLVCTQDWDGAAAAFIARLDDPARRVDALVELSDYDRPPHPLADEPLYSRLPQLKQRADLRAAITRAGGTRTFDVQRSLL